MDLTPLADHLPELRAIKAELDRQRELRKGRRARVSGMRGHIRQRVDAVLRTGDRTRIETALTLFESIRGRIGEKTGLADIDARITRAGEVQARLEAMLLEAVPAVEAAPEVPENGPGDLWKTCGKAGGKTRETSDGSDKNLRPVESRIDLKTKDKSLSARATFRSDGRLPVRDLSGSTGVAREREARAARVRQALAELAAAPLPERLRKVAREGTGLRPVAQEECLPREPEARTTPGSGMGGRDTPEPCPGATELQPIAREGSLARETEARTTTAAGFDTPRPPRTEPRPSAPVRDAWRSAPAETWQPIGGLRARHRLPKPAFFQTAARSGGLRRMISTVSPRVLSGMGVRTTRSSTRSNRIRVERRLLFPSDAG